MRYEGNIYRPPPEADAYILQCTIGCSYNKCTYCAMYKDIRYRVRTIDELKQDIRMAQASFGDKVEKVFLSDGDAISLPTEMLLVILSELYRVFPKLNHVSTYAGPQSTLDKSLDEFKKLRDAGLTMTYLGVESGSDEVLKAVRKGVSSEEMLTAGQNIVESGIKLVAMVMIGLGGRGELSKQHAKQTAKLINMMNPYLLGLLTTVAIEGTALSRLVEKGDFTLLDSYEVLEEVKVLLDTLNREELLIDSTHASNLLPMKGSLQAIKPEVIDKIIHTLLNRDSNIIGKAYLGRF
ncbi:radical SAM protein [Shewanella schlegeliana]|uniref:Radical SAM protein n=1 Tax=Shewanella schlegeliana TaxID=190308 RepID=A0ABS1T296_9GAMM|nr:radical SAM protein [Shewanella schlegeliana]MBL4913937.1 radical SAM protein [Shewanella schlegeliana]MCL1108679.1 radical SAM protein [Shewanella schlegeliana]GIU26521.1 radical SAM protein [Shewanella schlegeliana]